MLFWGHTAEEPPTETITIGHENTGYVVALGKDVKGFKIGDPVGCLGCSYACCKVRVHDATQSHLLTIYRRVRGLPGTQSLLRERFWSFTWIHMSWTFCRVLGS